MAQPYSYTVRQALLDLGQYVNDAKLLVATGTAPSTTTFRTTTIAGQSVDALKQSELMPWDQPAGSATVNLQLPATVTLNDAVQDITLGQQIFSTAFVAGNRALLQNFQGRGYPQAKKEFALKMAVMEIYRLTANAYISISTPSITDYWNALPAALRSVYRVTQYVAYANYEVEVAPAAWQDRIDLAGWRINLPYDWQTGDEARIYGRVDPTAWWDMLRTVIAAGDGGAILSAYAATIPGDPRRLILAAVPWLLDGKRDDKAAQMVEFNYARTQRESLERAMPNEVFLL